MLDQIFDIGSIIVADIVLSGDNALVIGMVAASLAPELRGRAILYGMIVAALSRMALAVVATYLLQVPGLLLVGALLLFWICWRLFLEIRADIDERAAYALETAADPAAGYTGAPRRSFAQAMISITVADVSMSLDNVLAVAAIADDNVRLLVFGLALAILLMAFAATMIMRLLARYPAISWLGLAVLLYVATDMFYRGITEPGLAFLAGLHPMGGS